MLMYRNRLIPCLLLRDKGLVKTIQFSGGRYLGDPINAVKIYNDCEVDELMILDIDATRRGKRLDFVYLAKIAQQCFMPVCYGGGIRDIDDIKKLFEIGYEKVAIGAVAYSDKNLIRDASNIFGSQSIMGVMDVSQNIRGEWDVYIMNGTRKLPFDLQSYARYLESLGVGELLINSIDRDGTMKGYDLELIRTISTAVSIPVVVCGGAKTLQDCKKAIKMGASAAAAGSMFVYWGRKRAILINYPDKEMIENFFVE